MVIYLFIYFPTHTIHLCVLLTTLIKLEIFVDRLSKINHLPNLMKTRSVAAQLTPVDIYCLVLFAGMPVRCPLCTFMYLYVPFHAHVCFSMFYRPAFVTERLGRSSKQINNYYLHRAHVSACLQLRHVVLFPTCRLSPSPAQGRQALSMTKLQHNVL